MHYTIYKITNKINNKFYIGKHKTANLDDHYMGSGKYLSHSIKKYGIDNFVKEIMFTFDNELEMNAKEKELVSKEFCLREDTYNLCEGGNGGFSYINSNLSLALEARKKARVVTDKILLEKYGVENSSQTSEARKKISENTKQRHKDGLMKLPPSWAGKKHLEETKKKIGKKNSVSQSGNKNSQFGTMWVTDGNINKKINKKELDFYINQGYYRGRVVN